jgi:Hsp70 protein
MTDPLGLSIGTTHLVAARVGSPPLTRRAVLTLYGGYAHAITITGFVERVGDPIPLVATDGSQHRSDRLLVEALAAMVADSGAPTSDITIARPAHWGSAALSALREALLTVPTFTPNGVLVPVVADATTALTALAIDPGLPADGVVGLIDFGASGTSLTLADAGSGFAPVDETVRYLEFSGDQIDQLLLTYVVDGLTGAQGVDTAATAAVESLGRLRDDCRDAKERLSSESATEVDVELPMHSGRIRLTRSELDGQIADPLTGVIAAFQELLQRNRIGPADLAAVATVGGVASIPLITQRLSEELRLPVVTTPRPELNAAAGAALLSARGPNPDAPTARESIPAATGTMPFAPPPDEPASSTFRALAWSEDDRVDDEPVPYSGEDYTYPSYSSYPETGGVRPPVQFVPRTAPPVDRTPRWYRRPMAAVGLAALVPLVAVGAFAYALTGSQTDTQNAPDTKRTTAPVSPPASSAPPAPSPNFVAPSTILTTSAASPPPPPPTHTVTTVVPAPETTTQPTTTRTTTRTTTTTTPPTTTTTTTPTTTTTTTTTTTSPTPTMTTSYLNVPFLPVPIPIQVPAQPTPSQAPYPYAPYPNAPYPGGAYPNGPYQ